MPAERGNSGFRLGRQLLPLSAGVVRITFRNFSSLLNRYVLFRRVASKSDCFMPWRFRFEMPIVSIAPS